MLLEHCVAKQHSRLLIITQFKGIIIYIQQHSKSKGSSGCHLFSFVWNLGKFQLSRRKSDMKNTLKYTFPCFIFEHRNVIINLKMTLF